MVREETSYVFDEASVLGKLTHSGNTLIHRKKLEAAAIRLEDGL